MIGDCLLSTSAVYLSVEPYHGKVITEHYFTHNNNWHALIDDPFFKWYTELTVILNFLTLFAAKTHYKLTVRLAAFCLSGF